MVNNSQKEDRVTGEVIHPRDGWISPVNPPSICPMCFEYTSAVATVHRSRIDLNLVCPGKHINDNIDWPFVRTAKEIGFEESARQLSKLGFAIIFTPQYLTDKLRSAYATKH